MKKLLITSFCSMLIGLTCFGQSYSEQERNKIVKDFNQSIEDAYNRISEMQQKGKLSQVQYMEEEKVIRDARQVLDLIREGNYVEKAKIQEWKKKLSKLGVDQIREGEGVQYKDKPHNKRGKGRSNARMNSQKRSEEVVSRGNELIKNYNARIKEARQNLEIKRKNGDISETEYQEKLQRLTRAEAKVKELQQKIDQHNQEMATLMGDN